MMTNQGMILGAMLCASLSVGCAGPELSGEGDDLEFRQSGGLGDFDPGYAGNGDIEVREGSDDDDDFDIPDTIIWDLDGGNVSRQVEPGVFVDRLSVDDDQLRTVADASGMQPNSSVCTAIEGDHPSGKVFHLVDDTGEVVLSVWKRHVFLGDVTALAGDDDDCDSDSEDGAVKLGDVKSQSAFSFKKDRIYAGPWSDGLVVATASEKIAKASPMRRLSLAALVTGECGSVGLP